MGALSPRSLRSKLTARSFIAAGILVLAALPVAAQQRYPVYSQKLAPFVPSPQRVVDRMLEMAAPKAGETVFDLGCGDGRVLVTAAQKYKAKAVGVEVDERLVQRATERISQSNLQGQVKVLQMDLLQADLSSADVVVIYLLTGSNEI